MKKLYKKLTALPDITREIITMRANGKKVVKTQTITNRYLLTLENGDSVALTLDQLKDLGIFPEKETKTLEISSNIAETVQDVAEIDEDDEDIVEPTASEENPAQIVA